MNVPSRAPTASTLTLPSESGSETIYEFLTERFAHVPANEWRRRFSDGEVCFEDGSQVDPSAPFQGGRTIFYFRSVRTEPTIPFDEQVLFENDSLLVIDKPHFLPVSPGGPFVNQCLIYRQRKRLGREDLKLVHRLDRDTAGLVLIAKGPRTSAAYSALFRRREIYKEYLAVARVGQEPGRSAWTVENRIAVGEPSFRSRVVEGPVNAITQIFLIEHRGDRGLFRLLPTTGKKHQIRLHLATLGFPILNERYYPDLLPKAPTDFEHPLQLLAAELRWSDPLTGQPMKFRSRRRLNWS